MTEEYTTFHLDVFALPPRMNAAELAETTRYMKTTHKLFSYTGFDFFKEPTIAASDIAHVHTVAIQAAAQLGKDLAWYTEMLTTHGFVTMRDLKVGDYVYAPDGSPTLVIAKTPPQFNPMYRVHFDDGTYLDAGEDHRWCAHKLVSKKREDGVYTTREMFDYCQQHKDTKHYITRGKTRSLFSIDMPSPIEAQEKDFIIEPYILGLWLGDGRTKDSVIYKPFEDLMEMLPEYAEYIKMGKTPSGSRVRIPRLVSKLRALHLLGNKRIPEEYFRGSLEQRLALLQGLCDTDGYCSKDGFVEWSQKSTALTEDFLRLCWSLGIKTHHLIKSVKIKEGDVRDYHIVHFKTALPVFRLTRKKVRQTVPTRPDTHYRYIRLIEPIPTVESYCISVAHSSHCYLAGKQLCITHNTVLLENIIHWIVKYDKSNVLYIADSQKTASKMAKTRFKSFLHEIGIDEIREKELRAGEKSDSTFLMSLGAGATLAVGSSKSASDLASMSARYILGDELARWETLKGEGNPLDLATQRQLQAGRGMRVLVSTPTDENCLITQEYLLGTQEVWGCLCGSCNKHFTVEWNLIDWTGETPTYTCPHCGESWTEKDISGFKHCYSEPHNPEPILDDKGRVYRSFQITGPNCLAIYTWKYLKELERASLARGQDSMQSFTNTRIGLPWTPPTEVRIDASALMRASMLRYTDTTLPLEIEYLCGGIDTHDNALYYTLWGFNRSLSSAYAITSHIIAGDIEKDSAPFSQLTAYLNRTYTREDGVTIRPHFAFIDSGGHKTQSVLLYSQINQRCKPVKGWDSTKRQEAPDPLIRREFSMVCERIKSRVPVVEISSGHGKDVFYELAKLTLAGDQRINASMKACFRENFFRGLCSEVRINGKWLALQGGKTPNEMLDCFVYALSAAHYYKENWALTGRDPEFVAQIRATRHKEKETMKEVQEVREEMKDQKEVKVKRSRKKKEVDEPSKGEVKEVKEETPVESPSSKESPKEASESPKESPSPKRKIHKF